MLWVSARLMAWRSLMQIAWTVSPLKTRAVFSPLESLAWRFCPITSRCFVDAGQLGFIILRLTSSDT